MAALDPLPASTDGEKIPIPFTTGATIQMGVEELQEINTNYVDLLASAITRRTEIRSSIANLTQFGLEPMDTTVTGDIQWTLPGSFGVMPYGVPMLHYIPVSRRFSVTATVDSERAARFDTWNLSLSINPTVSVASAAYNDLPRIRHLAHLLHNADPEAMSVELALTGYNFRANVYGNDYDADAVQVLAHRLLPTARRIPVISPNVLQALASAGLNPGSVSILDPNLCRLIHTPGIVHVSHDTWTMKDIDAALAAQGLIPLSCPSPHRWWGKERYAVPRGYRAPLGALPDYHTKVLVVESVEDDSQGLNAYFTEVHGVANLTRLTYPEWDTIIARRAVTAASQ
jgi:hypothetical protein